MISVIVANSLKIVLLIIAFIVTVASAGYLEKFVNYLRINNRFFYIISTIIIVFISTIGLYDTITGYFNKPKTIPVIVDSDNGGDEDILFNEFTKRYLPKTPDEENQYAMLRHNITESIYDGDPEYYRCYIFHAKTDIYILNIGSTSYSFDGIRWINNTTPYSSRRRVCANTNITKINDQYFVQHTTNDGQQWGPFVYRSNFSTGEFENY